jgi:hypothetical protein
MGIAPKNWAREDDEEAAPRPSPTSRRKQSTLDLDLCEEMGKAVAIAIREATAPLEKRIAELEANQVTFGDTWKDGQSYPEKCIVTHGGSAWLSKMPNNTTKPGDGLSWRLIVKRGRDGKDGRDVK